MSWTEEGETDGNSIQTVKNKPPIKSNGGYKYEMGSGLFVFLFPVVRFQCFLSLCLQINVAGLQACSDTNVVQPCPPEQQMVCGSGQQTGSQVWQQTHQVNGTMTGPAHRSVLPLVLVPLICNVMMRCLDFTFSPVSMTSSSEQS